MLGFIYTHHSNTYSLAALKEGRRVTFYQKTKQNKTKLENAGFCQSLSCLYQVVVLCPFLTGAPPRGKGLREGQISGQFPDSVLPAHLLELHSAVLKPNLDLPVSEVYALTDL